MGELTRLTRLVKEASALKTVRRYGPELALLPALYLFHKGWNAKDPGKKHGNIAAATGIAAGSSYVSMRREMKAKTHPVVPLVLGSVGALNGIASLGHMERYLHHKMHGEKKKK